MAQRTDSLPSQQFTLVGLVVDTRDRAVGDVQIALLEAALSVRSATDGTFAFEKVAPGEYVLLVRRVGFEPIQRKISIVGDTRGLMIRIVPLPQSLPPVVTRASRIGVGGVVLDAENRPVAGADVSLNGGRKAKTDDAGRFFIRTPVGRFLLQVRSRGYATQMVSVTVNPDDGGEVSVWLTRSARNAAGRDAAVMDGLRRRLLNRSPVWSRLFTREDINRAGFTTLDQIVTAGVGRSTTNAFSIEGECMATVDGLYRVPVWSLEVAEIEFAEVYGSPPRRPQRTRTSALGNPPDCPAVYVWLRQ